MSQQKTPLEYAQARIAETEAHGPELRAKAIAQARADWAGRRSNDELEIDDNAYVLYNNNGGFWVQAWVYVIEDDIRELAKYYECGICDQLHRQDWNGDCRENAARFTYDDIPADAEVISWEEMQARDAQEEPSQ